MTDARRMDHEAKVIQDLQVKLSTNPQAITHVLLMSIDDGKTAEWQRVFFHLANEAFNVKVTLPGRAPVTVTLMWEAPRTRSSSSLYYCTSLYSDMVTTEATKLILQGGKPKQLII
jgi:hypothetical protein